MNTQRPSDSVIYLYQCGIKVYVLQVHRHGPSSWRCGYIIVVILRKEKGKYLASWLWREAGKRELHVTEAAILYA